MENMTETTAVSIEKNGSGFGADGATPLTPETPLAETPRFTLRRSRTDRMLGGVCGGLAESLNIDVAMLRIGFVALTVLGAGSGVILYLAAWVLAPESDVAAA